MAQSHRKSNADFNPIVNELVRINATEEAQEIDYKSIYDLLPSNLDAFYTYSGSLTTPPCYQVVNWVVMAERLNMNAKQIEMFRNLYAPAAEPHNLEHERKPQQPGEARYHKQGAEQQQAATTTAGVAVLDRELEDGDKLALIVPNVRSLQPLNNRTILASFTKYGSRIEAAWNGASPSLVHLNANNHFSSFISGQSNLISAIARSHWSLIVVLTSTTLILAQLVRGGAARAHCHELT